MYTMKGINVKEHSLSLSLSRTHTHIYLCVVEKGVFLQENFDLLMFGARPTCQLFFYLPTVSALHYVSSLTY
jgi:hypothetical protein